MRYLAIYAVMKILSAPELNSSALSSQFKLLFVSVRTNSTIGRVIMPYVTKPHIIEYD